jgi:nicotinate-nucleotide--dimethylbenzimidazole phosphoribosyltransferase
MVEGMAMTSRLDALPRLQAALARVRPADSVWRERAEAHLARLTKPPYSLGRLEWVAARLCAIQGTISPRTEPRRIVVFAADHGVAAEGVSAYPSAVTAQMVGNFLRGGAAINALAREAACDLCVVDVGVAGEIDETGHRAAFASRRVRPGARNIAEGPAMSIEEVAAAVNAGLESADLAAADGVAVFACGDMGIGNTTPASAMTAALTGAPVEDVTGRGTGIDDDAIRRKAGVISRALAVNRPGRDSLEVLRTVGGLEIAAICGAYVGAAAHRMALVGDGFIATAAALVAHEICPGFQDYWFAGHRSSEPGHAVQLRFLGQEPLLQLDMRLGEGTGAVLAMHLLAGAAAVINGMATFESAGISARVDDSDPTPSMP